MAKAPTFDSITAGFASATVYNANNTAIVTSFDNTISRDGSAPNTMTADFDLNSNDLLNGGTINAVEITVNGVALATQVAAAATSATEAAASAAIVALLTEFTNLTDTPANYTSSGGLFVKVNAGETALEFVSGSGIEPSNGDKGDITVTSSGTVWSIDAGVVDTAELATDAVTTIKITDANVTTAKIANVNITTGKIADNAVTLAKLEHGTTGDTLYYGASGEPFRLAKGSDTEVLTLVSGLPSWAVSTSGGVTRGTAIATTSGTTHDFTGLTAGTDRITIMLDGVSLSGTDNLLIRIGDAGGFETTGYTSSASLSAFTANSNVGFVLNLLFAATELISGSIVLTRIDGNTWVSSGNVRHRFDNFVASSAGTKTLSAELTQVRLMTTGSNTFDAGKFNIFTE